jgi:hypothetical protein
MGQHLGMYGFTSEGHFSFYNVLERSFLEVFCFSYISYHANTTHCGRIIYVKISSRRASPSPRRQIRETTPAFCTPNLRPFCTSNRLFLHPEPLVFEKPTTITTTYDDYHDIPRHTTYYHDISRITKHFARRIFCLLHAESSAFYTPNLLHFARRIFSIFHAESSAFCTPNLQHFPRRIFCLLHAESSAFCTSNLLPCFAPKPTTITTTYHVLPRHTTYYQPFCTQNLLTFCTRYARHPPFGTPNLQHFPRRIFCLLHAESSAFCTSNLLPCFAPNLPRLPQYTHDRIPSSTNAYQ